MPLVALGIAAGVAGGAATAYGAHESSKATEQATATTAASNAAAIAEQQRQDAQQKAEFDAQQAALLNQWNAEQNIRAPYRAAGAAALGSLGDILGVNFNSSNSPSSTAPPAPTATAPASGSSASASGDPASYALSLVSTGVSPAQAAQQTNSKFNLQTGAQAVYYPDTNTIGLPNAYLAGPTNKPDSPSAWGIVPRSNAASVTKTPVSNVATQTGLAPTMAPITGNPLAAPYSPVVPISTLMGAR